MDQLLKCKAETALTNRYNAVPTALQVLRQKLKNASKTKR